jgi:hypothetical protein
MVNKYSIVQPLVKRDPARFRGPLLSEKYNSFQDAVVHDIVTLSTAVNTNAQKIRGISHEMTSEMLYLKRRLQALEEGVAYNELVLGKVGVKIDRYIDFHDTSGFVFLGTIPADKAAPLKGQFGEIFLPSNAVENKFFNFSLRTTEIVVPDDLTVEVTSQFDKLDGNGLQNFEGGGKVQTGTALYAFNGINELAWSRQVTFPLESDVDEVEVQLTAVVPRGLSSKANLIEIVPFPEGSVDVSELSTAPDLGSSFTMVDQFEDINNITSTRYHFPPRNVEQIRIRLRCRNWREVNGKKVFIYGLQELGLKLVDYKKGFSVGDNFADNPTAVLKVEAPKLHTFGHLFRVDTTPDFIAEDADKRHVRLRLSSTSDYSGVFWDSDVHAPPQNGTSTGVSMSGATTVYAFFTLKFVESSGGYSSPYQVGTTSFVKGLGLLFTAIPTDTR